MGFDETEAETSLEPIQEMLELGKIKPVKQTFTTKIDTTKLTEEVKQILEIETKDDGTSTIKLDFSIPQEIIEQVEKVIDKKDVIAFKRTVAILKNKTINLP